MVIEEYLNKIIPYLKDIVNNLKKFDTWKIQLTIANKFISSIDNDEERVIHSKSHNIDIMINDEADEVIKELFHSLKDRKQNNLESMKVSQFVFGYVHNNKNTIINPINKKVNKWFQYAVTVALNHEEIKKALQKITKIKHFINKCNWKGIKFPSEKGHWKKFEKNNVTIALNVLYA